MCRIVQDIEDLRMALIQDGGTIYTAKSCLIINCTCVKSIQHALTSPLQNNCIVVACTTAAEIST